MLKTLVREQREVDGWLNSRGINNISCIRTAGFIVTEFLGIRFSSLKCMLKQRSILYFLWVPFEI